MRAQLLLPAIVAAVLLAPCGGIAAPAPTPAAASIRPSGETRLHEVLGGVGIAITIVTHPVPVGRVSDPPPNDRLNSCTHSKIPCALTDLVKIAVDGAALHVPRSTFSDLADLNRARLVLVRPGQFALKLEGGDASEGYEAIINFTRRRVLSRSIRLGELNAVAETTTYFELPALE